LNGFILPHSEERDPWVSAAELRRIVRGASADPGLLVTQDADFSSFEEVAVFRI
jgi:hypothetical protein